MDYNFFIPYVKVRPKTDYVFLTTFAIFAFFVVGLSLMTAYEYFRVSQYKTDIEYMNNTMASDTFKQSLREYEAKTAEYATVQSEARNFKTFDNYTKLSHTANENTIASLSNMLSQNMFLDSIQIDNGTITLKGTATKKSVIGDFENNLRNSGNFLDVFVNNASLESILTIVYDKTTGEIIGEEYREGYVFEITCELDRAMLLNSDGAESKIWAESINSATGGGGN